MQKLALEKLKIENKHKIERLMSENNSRVETFIDKLNQSFHSNTAQPNLANVKSPNQS
jgi:hypothetical protein